MSDTHRLRIRLKTHNYNTVMAEAERRGAEPSQVIDDYIEATRLPHLTGPQIYGSVLDMKTLLHRILAKARVNGIDLDRMGLPIAALDAKLTMLHRQLLETNGVDLSGLPKGIPVEPMTLEQELRLELELEQEQGDDLDQGDAR